MNIITDLQRRIKLVLLSIIGASVHFINCKQLPDEKIETYANVLNDLASACKYSDCCRDRLFRDTFVSSLLSSVIVGSLLEDCEDKSFNQCVERAKMIEKFTADAQDITFDPKLHRSFRMAPDRKRYIENGSLKVVLCNITRYYRFNITACQRWAGSTLKVLKYKVQVLTHNCTSSTSQSTPPEKYFQNTNTTYFL